jgi:ABC-2 type transport system ATP-binding protein
MCDQIAIINNGAVITRDTTANLLGRVSGKTMVVMPEGDVPAPAGLPEGLRCDRRDTGALAFTYDQRAMSAGEVLDHIRAAGVTIRDVRTEEADLEQVFLSLTRSGAAA